MKPIAQPAGAPASGSKATRVLLLGGFMGAGKTTLLLQLAKHLSASGKKPGVITNGYRSSLIDTTLYENEGYPVIEVTGGCFCAKMAGLLEPVSQLTRQGMDVILVEAWGTCTGLPAVLAPLRGRPEFLPTTITVAVDSRRALALFGPSPMFSDPVKSLFRKQLQETELILLNKSDLLNPQEQAELKNLVAKVSPSSEILVVSGRTGMGLEPWFTSALKPPVKPALPTSESSAHGQSLLAGVHARVQLSSVRYFDAAKVLWALAEKVQDQLKEGDAELAHLHMMINAEEDLGEIATINLPGNHAQPEITRKVSEPLERGDLIINLSAEGDSESLANRLNGALHDLMEENPNLFARLEESEHFTAGKSHGRTQLKN